MTIIVHDSYYTDRCSTTSTASHRRGVSAGAGLMVPAETVHAVKNIGTGNAAELATYIVEKGKPLLVVVD
jgi:hypothetical protein